MKYEVNYITYDVETTGFYAYEHITKEGRKMQNQIASIAFDIFNNDLVDLGNWESFLQPIPGRDLEAQAFKYNGLNESIMKDKGVTPKELYTQILDMLKKYKIGIKNPILVGHNSSKFDNAFLEELFEFNNDNLWKYVEQFNCDTMFFSRMMWGNIDVENHKLTETAARAGIILTDAHDAKNDTKATKELMKFFIQRLRNNSAIVNSETTGNNYVRKFQF